MSLSAMPRLIDITITGRCNLRCRYCSHFSSAGDVNNDLPTEEWLAFFAELGNNQVTDVHLSGGEPFMRPDLKELLEGIASNRMRFLILSNGMLISDDMAHFLASTKRCEGVQLSIDGSKPETHDACRGEGSLAGALRAAKLLKKHDVPVAVRVTIHKHNVDDLEDIARSLLEDLKIPSFTTNAASHMGLCRENADELRLTVEERSLAMAKLLELSRKYDGRIGGSAGPLAEARIWREMMRARRSGLSGLPGRGVLKGCNGMFRSMAVRTDGIMVPCPQMSHLEMGRINRDSLARTWLEHPHMNRLRNRRNIPLDTFEFCKDCQYIPYCTGNCPALSYTALGIEDHPCPDTCLRLFLEQGGRVPE
jgi:SynChlorMet cassette radical SAM/SPASM protein ScmE